MLFFLSMISLILLNQLFAFIAIIAAFLLIISFNPVYRILNLICLFLSSSLLFILFDYYAIAYAFIIVYIGAMAILFLFAIMMKKKEKQN